MYQNTYKIKKAFLVALSVDVVLLFLLCAMSLFLKSAAIDMGIFTFISIIALFILIEALSRKVLTGDQGILISKFFKRREFRWEDITHVGVLVLRKRVYVLLTTTKGFYIISNAYEAFPHLLSNIADRVDKEKIEEEAHDQIEHPINRMTDIISAWFAAALLVALIAYKLITS
jgi:hypothetical protein